MSFCKNLGLRLVSLLLFLIVAGCSEEKAGPNKGDKSRGDDAPARVCKGGSVVIEDLWLTPGPVEGTSGGYATVRIESGESDSLLAVACDIAERVELHEMQSENGETVMQKITTPLYLSKSDPIVLEPGGKHIMLIDLKKELQIGKNVDLSFRWSSGERTTCPGVVSNAPPEKYLRGSEIYISYCAACHGQAGEGQGNIYPPLAGSDFFADKEKTISAIVNGLHGEITVNGKKYNGIMNKLPSIYDNQEAAEVINFTLQQFADSLWQTTKEVVARIRD